MDASRFAPCSARAPPAILPSSARLACNRSTGGTTTSALLPPALRTDVLLEERLQAIDGRPARKLPGADMGGASCRSGGRGQDPAHLFAAAVSMSLSGRR